ncbi:hypothetical protein K439DRAFT_1397830, partial [Ramaria rubella]
LRSILTYIHTTSGRAETYFAGFTGLCPPARGVKLAARRPGARANGAALRDATFRSSLAHYPSLISTRRTSTKLVRHAASGQVRSGQIPGCSAPHPSIGYTSVPTGSQPLEGP